MVAVTQQSVWDVIKDLPEEKKQEVMSFAITLSDSVDDTATERVERMDKFLDSFRNVELDEKAISDFRERSTI